MAVKDLYFQTNVFMVKLIPQDFPMNRHVSLKAWSAFLKFRVSAHDNANEPSVRPSFLLHSSSDPGALFLDSPPPKMHAALRLRVLTVFRLWAARRTDDENPLYPFF